MSSGLNLMGLNGIWRTLREGLGEEVWLCSLLLWTSSTGLKQIINLLQNRLQIQYFKCRNNLFISDVQQQKKSSLLDFLLKLQHHWLFLLNFFPVLRLFLLFLLIHFFLLLPFLIGLIHHTQILLHYLQKIFGRKHALHSFSEDYAVGADVKLDPIFDRGCHIDLYDDVTGPSHSRDDAFFFGQAGCEVDVVSGHALESLIFYQRPKLGQSAVDDNGVQTGIFYFGQQVFSFDYVHGMALSCSDENVVFSFFNLEAFLIVGFHDFSDVLLVDVSVSLGPEVWHELIERDIAAGVDGESFLDCAVPENPRHSFGETCVFVLVMPSIFAFALHVELLIL